VVSSHGTRRAALGALLGAALLRTVLLEPAAQARKKLGSRRRTGKPAGSKKDPGTDPTDPRSLKNGHGAISDLMVPTTTARDSPSSARDSPAALGSGSGPLLAEGIPELLAQR
jgi:hypothetical protein